MYFYFLLYHIAIRGYTWSIHLVALFQKKAALWVSGRRNWRQRYKKAFAPTQKVLWMHVSSLGEFEQGRPVLEDFRRQYPDWQIVLSFFSPSGFELRKNYPHADFIAYLPADTPGNARDWLDIIRPDLAIFVKYDFWANYLHALQRRNVPTLLVSALFRPSQPFFRWYGAFWRRMLGCFTHIFVQNQASLALLAHAGFHDGSLAGDNRVDRVLNIAASAPENPLVAAFSAGAKVFVVGSSWAADEAVYLPVLLRPEWAHFKLLIAPHDPSGQAVRQLEMHINRLNPALQAKTLRYSEADPARCAAARILIVNNVGLLNTLYRYGAIAYIGGGFGKGIHNTLEPAAWGLPVVFGPKYGKFEEARRMLAQGGAFCITDGEVLHRLLVQLSDTGFYTQARAAVEAVLSESRGATEKVMIYISAYFEKTGRFSPKK